MDMDIGEMFHNYPLHEGIQAFCGVNLSAFNEDFKNLSKEKRFRWRRLWFGFKPSPYLAVRYQALSKEEAKGDHLDQKIHFTSQTLS